MKILAILGSPKGKGDGYKLVTSVEQEMRQLGEVEFDYFFLREQRLEPCKGCFVCVTRGEERCPLRDDRQAIEARIEAADGVILVSPSYVSNVTWLMKNFIDRFCYTNHRPRFFRQKLMLLSNAGSGMEDTVKALRLALGAGPQNAAELTCLTPPWPLTERAVRKQERRIRKKSAAFYEAILRDQPRRGLPKRPSFGDYLRFRFFKKISADTRAYLRADYDYYRELHEYYYPTTISPVTRIAATLLLKVSMLLMRDLAPGEGAVK
jgi:NAD(P)H-dependent FMN reductase